MAEAATVQAGLWSARAGDWADVMEGWNGWGIPLYRHVLERVPVGPGTDVLDVGCGAGRFARMAADRGADVSGLDATPAFVEIAANRVLGGDFRVGDMQSLPWDDDSFDLVTGFNSFFIADDIATALREARRVTRPGGVVAMTVFGRPEHCYSTNVFKGVAALLPPREPGGGGAPLHAEGALEDIAAAAGLEPRAAGYLRFDETYADLDTLLRGLMAAPPMVRAGRAAGDAAVRAAVTSAVAPFRQDDGGYRMAEEIRWLTAA